MGEHQLYDKLKKGEFWLEQVVFQSHAVSKEGIKVDLQEVETILEWLRTINVFKMRNFLSLAESYQMFIKEFSKIGSYVTNELRTTIKFKCVERCNKVF